MNQDSGGSQKRAAAVFAQAARVLTGQRVTPKRQPARTYASEVAKVRRVGREMDVREVAALLDCPIRTAMRVMIAGESQGLMRRRIVRRYGTKVSVVTPV